MNIETLDNIIKEATPHQGKKEYCSEVVAVGELCKQMMLNRQKVDQRLLNEKNEAERKVLKIERELAREKKIVDALLNAMDC